MYEDILLPFDGSDGATAVLEHAGELAQWADATLHVLCVADTTRDSVTTVGTRVVDALVQEGEAIVAEAASTLGRLGVDYETDVVQGNPAPTIVEYADEYDHDLIVMATHGRVGIRRHLMGSVSEKVVRLSPVPVLTARMQPDEQLAFPYERILIPTDGSSGATRGVHHGLALAAALDATVHALSVVEDISLGLDVRSTIAERDRDQAANQAVADLVSVAEEYGVTDIERAIEHGSPLAEIIDYIEENDIHAVVMGTTGRSGTDRILLGSIAEQTVREAPVPVITTGNRD